MLLTNDDGVHAPGIRALERAFSELDARVLTAAPAEEQSARSHAFTMHRPVRIERVGPDRYAVGGTPADAVYAALHHLCDERPALVVSGVNWGSNLGDDVHYSGTVAAAREAALAGLPALAVSLGDPAPPGEARFDTAAAFARRVAERVLAEGLPPGCFLNLNVPDVPLDRAPPVRLARLGRRRYAAAVEPRRDPRGRTYYWLGGGHLGFEGDEDTDGRLFERGFATLVPLSIDLTHEDALVRLRAWGG